MNVKTSSKATPTKPAEITLEWLNCVLADYKPQIERFEMNKVDAGLYGNIVRIEVFYEGDSTTSHSFVAKFASENTEIREALSSFGIYEREVMFYTKLADSSPVDIPKCYFAYFDPKNHETVLLLDWVEGNVFSDATGANEEQAKAAFSMAARLHGHWLDNPVLTSEWIHDFGAPPILDGYVGAVAASAPRGAELLGEYLPDWITGNAHRAHDIAREQMVELQKLPHTLVHVDYRLSNMLFPAEGGAPTLIDWQGALRAPGALDLSSFCTFALGVEDRRKWEHELVLEYLSAVHGWSEAEWPEWFTLAWRRLGIWSGFNLIRNAGVLDLSDPETKNLLLIWAERICAIVDDHNALSIL